MCPFLDCEATGGLAASGTQTRPSSWRATSLEIGVGDDLSVVLGLQDAPGVLIDVVLDEVNAAVGEAGIHSGGMIAAGHGGIHLVARRVREAAHAGGGADAVVPE